MIDPTDEPAFWRFSVQFYRQPAVAEVCLLLQDEFGIDVNLLLFVLWRRLWRLGREQILHLAPV